MLEIITTVATFRNWRDCYLYMKEEGIDKIKVIETRYCLEKVFGSNSFTIQEVKQMAFEME